MLLATDRSGVLESDDAATTFKASNTGFSQRQVASLLVDAKTPQTILAGVVNDKSYGGVFISHDGGASWSQQSNGLQGRDVFSLSQSADGVILAGTNAGIFRWDGASWQPDGKIVKSETKTSYVVSKGKRTKVEKTVMVPDGQIDGRVSEVDASGSTWYAATATGSLRKRGPGCYLGRWAGAGQDGVSCGSRCWTDGRGSRANRALRIAGWRQNLAAAGHAAEAHLAAVHRVRGRMAACGWAAVKASSIARIMGRTGRKCPRCPSLTSVDWPTIRI